MGYRDAQGRPRQRLLANLHGEPDTLRALARLAVRRTSLLADRQALANGKATDEEGELIDVRFARQLIADIDAELADLAREQAILKRHCTATPKEIQATAKAYKRELENAANAAVGRMLLWSLEKQLKGQGYSTTYAHRMTAKKATP